MGSFGQNQRRRYVSSSSPGGGTWGAVAVYDCLDKFYLAHFSKRTDKFLSALERLRAMFCFMM